MANSIPASFYCKYDTQQTWKDSIIQLMISSFMCKPTTILSFYQSFYQILIDSDIIVVLIASADIEK